MQEVPRVSLRSNRDYIPTPLRSVPMVICLGFVTRLHQTGRLREIKKRFHGPEGLH